MSKIPNEFMLSGETTREHVMHGEARDPAHCAEKLGVADAWLEKFGHLPKAIYVDRERIKVKDEGKWWWGPPTEQQIANLTALDNGKRYAVKPHEWEVHMIKKADVIPMTDAVRKKLQEYDKHRKPQQSGPTVRRRIPGLTRMVQK